MKTILILLMGSLMSLPAADRFSFAATPGQLPKDILPGLYELEIVPNLANLTTSGSERISLQVLKSTHDIVLNAVDIEITHPQLNVGGESYPLTATAHTRNQTIVLTSAKAIPPGTHRLAFRFTGKISQKSEGLYLDEYDSPSGRKMQLATQMEPLDARRMFPCWDEPAFRAQFKLSVGLPTNFLAFSNMPIEKESMVGSSLKMFSFATTPSMSSYLLALEAGEFDVIKDVADGVPIRVVTRPGEGERGRFALNSLKQILPFYNQYFAHPYALPKLDLIAVQNFSYGAMENWGAIVFREDALLFDPAKSPESTRQRVFSIIAHEVAHQWFGDLVTMAWWDDLWLNEGFASWMQNKATDRFHPEAQAWLRANQAKERAMDLDARKTTHAVKQPLLHENEVNDAFDAITYSKAALFIRMLENYLGEDSFRQGVQSYIAKHQFSNTRSGDLWAALESSSHRPVREMAEGWTERSGYPLVKIESTMVNGRTQIRFSQERFTLHDPSAEARTWSVPVTFRLLGNPLSHSVMLASRAQIVPVMESSAPLKANPENIGYFVAQYSPELWSRLEPAIMQFSPADRVNLLSDAWELTRAGKEPPSFYLRLIAKMTNDSSLATWEQIIPALATLHELERGQPGEQAFEAMANRLLENQANRLGWTEKPGESASEQALRGLVLSSLSTFGNADVLKRAKEQFERYLKKTDSLPPNLRALVFETMGRYADEATWDQLHTLGKNSSALEEKLLFYHALEATTNAPLAQRTLELSLSNELPATYAARTPGGVSVTGHHPEAAWNFMQEHWKELTEKNPTGQRGRFVAEVFSGFWDESRAAELEAFAKKNLPDDPQRRIREVAEEIRFKSDLKKRLLPGLSAVLMAPARGS